MLKNEFSLFGSKEMGLGSVLFQMFFEALQSLRVSLPILTKTYPLSRIYNLRTDDGNSILSSPSYLLTRGE